MKNASESVSSFLLAQLAALYFTLPTSAVIWLLANTEFFIWHDSMLGLKGFALIFGFFCVLSVFFPRALPVTLGHCWRLLTKLSPW